MSVFSMSRLSAIGLAASVAVAMSVAPAISQSRTQVTSKIVGQNCARKYASFTVPAGKTASGFQIQALASGRTCKTNQTIGTQGFQIRNANYNNVYSYSASSGRQTGGGNLSALSLPAGKYSVSVDGGNGAVVTLSFVVQ